ncbi:MAG TPA: DUF4352 domain-containing protein [Ktedonobacterales bacterium]|nr:DUF4352 domain-containing protein [Ktedonobacterales bacterium]
MARIPLRVRLYAAIGVMLVAALLIIACGGSSAANSGAVVTGTVPLPSVTPLPHFKVGEQVKVGDTWIVTVTGVTTTDGDFLSRPADGTTYLVIAVSLTNISSQEQTVSSFLQFSLKDQTGQQYGEAIVDFAKAPDGKVEAADLIRGNIVYQVPTALHQFTFAFQADITRPGQTLWDISD